MPQGSATRHQLELFVAFCAILLIGAATVTANGAGVVAPAAAFLVVIAIWRPTVLEWRALVLVLFLIILFVPIRRYSLAVNLPFQLEPYRLYVLFLGALWATFLLLDRRLRVRATGLEGPLALLGIAVVGSIVMNFDSIAKEDLSTEIVKKLTFWIGFLVVLYMIASLSSVADIDLYLRTLVLGTAVLGLLGVVEWKTGMNAFAGLDRVVPILSPAGEDLDTFRAGLNRAYGSAQHPIAFGAALVLVLPLSVVMAFRRRNPIWVVCAGLIIMGSLATISRTSLVMLGVSVAVLVALRPQAARQALPFLLPLLVAIQIALPGTFSTIRASFFPSEGLIDQQAEQDVGSGRVASLGPAIDEAASHPFFGRGFGTRIVGDDPKENSFILDDEWLSTTLEIGLVGLAAWGWIFFRFCSRAIRVARENDDERGWLLAALASSIASFAVGMLFFDAFSFIQVTLLMIILLGLGSVLLNASPADRAQASRGLAGSMRGERRSDVTTVPLEPSVR
jgi:polysaccharide biosynthesis protein PslJ